MGWGALAAIATTLDTGVVFANLHVLNCMRGHHIRSELQRRTRMPKTMRRLILAAVTAWVFSATSFAETFTIRVRYNTNLRASYSLESAILAKALAGTTLSVVGQNNRWLKVNRDGREYWMASWVAYERVEGVTNRSEIDNCCFVNRQCANDKEWIEGFWAYQRNECPAGAPTTPASVAEPASSAPARVDNCCGIDRVCNTDQDWTNGYWAYQNKQCATQPTSAPESFSRPHIEGSPAFVRWITAALDLLEARTPHWYKYIVSYTNIIVEVPDEDGPRQCTARVNTGERRVMVQTDCRAFNSRLTFIAGVLAHEACHVYHRVHGITYPEGRLREEWECGKPHVAVSNLLSPALGATHMPWEEYISWMRTNPFS